MKKNLLTIFILMITVCLSAQTLELTPNGLVDANDPSKDYVVLDFPNQSKENLFKAAKLYINTIYNNPKFVTSEVENEQIVINARDPKQIKLKGTALFDVNYNLVLSFKDNKLKFDLQIKDFERNLSTHEVQTVSGMNLGVLGKSVIFDNKGKLVNKTGKNSVEAWANVFINLIEKGIQSQMGEKDSDW